MGYMLFTVLRPFATRSGANVVHKWRANIFLGRSPGRLNVDQPIQIKTAGYSPSIFMPSLGDISNLRVCEKITSHFRIPSSGYIRPILPARAGQNPQNSPAIPVVLRFRIEQT